MEQYSKCHMRPNNKEHAFTYLKKKNLKKVSEIMEAFVSCAYITRNIDTNAVLV